MRALKLAKQTNLAADEMLHFDREKMILVLLRCPLFSTATLARNQIDTTSNQSRKNRPRGEQYGDEASITLPLWLAEIRKRVQTGTRGGLDANGGNQMQAARSLREWRFKRKREQ